MNQETKSSRTAVVLFLLSASLFLAAVFMFFADFTTDIRVDQAGGAYAFSPDRRWMAEIWDGVCEENGKNYAVVQLWDVEKYPSLKNGISLPAGKKPEIKLVFPQDFHARDSKCDVSWVSPQVFKIVFESDGRMKKFEYDTSTDDFELSNLAPGDAVEAEE